MRGIFVGGCDRSGSTMLGDMLGAAKDAVTVPEALWKVTAVRAVGWDGGPSREKAISCLRAIVADPGFKPWNTRIDPDEIAQGMPPHPELRDVVDALVLAFAKRRGIDEPKLWIDPTPDNIRHADWLLERFPDAGFVHLVRDGRAVAASLMPLDWGSNTIIHAARYWKERVRTGFAAEARHERLARVRYEDLVAVPEQALPTLCRAVAILYDTHMALGGSGVPSRGNSGQHRVVGGPPSTARIDAWRARLSAREIEIFEALAGDLLDSLGYERAHAHTPRPPSIVERTRAWVAEMWRRGRNKGKKRGRGGGRSRVMEASQA